MKSIALFAVLVLASTAAYAQNCTTRFYGNTARTSCEPAYRPYGFDLSSIFNNQRSVSIPDVVGAQQRGLALREQRLRVRALERRERAAQIAEVIGLLSWSQIGNILNECKLLTKEYAELAGMDYLDSLALCSAADNRR